MTEDYLFDSPTYVIHSLMEGSITLKSPAKINYSLTIHDKLPSGLHSLDSEIYPISLFDLIKIEKSTHDQFVVLYKHKQKELFIEDDTISQLLHFIRLPALNQLKITIEKNIPMGGGLGGSSSNAGTLLKWLISQGSLCAQTAFRIGASIGADVPFFIGAQHSLVSGFGEIVQSKLSHHRKKKFFILVIPPIHVSTQKVFSHFDNNSFTISKRYPHLSKNHLLESTLSLHPELMSILKILAKLPSKQFGMSGSGSCFFAEFETIKQCIIYSKDLEKTLRSTSCNIIVTQTI